MFQVNASSKQMGKKFIKWNNKQKELNILNVVKKELW